MLNNNKIKQIFSLYSATLLSVIVGLGVSIFNTRLLGVDAFGDFKFIQIVFNFTTVLILFGFFNSVARLLTVNEGKEKTLYGGFVLITVIISIIGILLVWSFSFVQEYFFTDNLGSLLRITAIFITPIVFLNGLQNILKGSGKIGLLSLIQVLPQLAYLLTVIFLANLTVLSAITINYSLSALIIFGVIWSLKPSFKNIKETLKSIVHENNIYGKHIYYGSVANLASGQLGGIIIGFYFENKEVGFFSLAITMAAPLVMVPSIIGTTYFKEFAGSINISRKLILYTMLTSLLSYIAFNLLAKPVVQLFYSSEFSIVIMYGQVLGLGAIMHGFGDLFNRFMGANGQGKLIRNGAYIVGLFNILGYVTFIALWGVKGALITRVISGFLYLIVMYLGYKKYVKTINI